MKYGWFDRLRAEIERDERSLRELSAAAGLGSNFISQMLKHGRQPSGDNLAAILNALRPEASPYVLLDLHVTASDLALLNQLQSLPQQSQAQFLAFLRSLSVE